MTEIHDPVRLMVVVEQSPEIALAAIRSNPGIFEWVKNGWVFYSCVDPKTAEAYLFEANQMHKIQGLIRPKKSWKTSLEAGRESRRNLPVGLIETGEARDHGKKGGLC